MVRLVGEGVEPNIYPLREALRIVEELGVDLVEIQPDANPPVCKAMDYKKFVFDQKKRLKEQKAKATKVVIKEIRLGPQTDDHDFEFKLNHAKRFPVTGSGKLKRKHAYHGHILTKKSQKRKRNLDHTAIVERADEKVVKQMLLM